MQKTYFMLIIPVSTSECCSECINQDFESHSSELY